MFDRFENSSLTAMKLSMQDFKLELSKGKPGVTAAAGAVKAEQNQPVRTCGIAGTGAGADPAEPDGAAIGAVAYGSCRAAKQNGNESGKEGNFINAPMVGTYYAASSPGQSPFVMCGDRVFKGQTVCLMEAMKMVSEIPAPCDCIIEEILKGDGELAAFGEPLFRYQPC